MHYYKVLHDFEAEDDIELTVHTNELLCTEKNIIQNGWIRVSVLNEAQRKGFVPISYISEIHACDVEEKTEEAGNETSLSVNNITPRNTNALVGTVENVESQGEKIHERSVSAYDNTNLVSSPALTSVSQCTPPLLRREIAQIKHYGNEDSKETWRSTPSVSLEREYALLTNNNAQTKEQLVVSQSKTDNTRNDNNSSSSNSNNISSTIRNTRNVIDNNSNNNNNNMQLIQKSPEWQERISESRWKTLSENTVRNEIYYKQLTRQRKDIMFAMQSTLESARNDMTACRERSSFLSNKLKQLDNIVESNRERVLQAVRDEQKKK